MNRNKSLFVALTTVALALCAPQVVAQGTAKPDLAKAKEIAQSICAACHGADGNSAVSINPNLAGQGADYITRQLQHFKSGVRANAIMQGMVATLSPEDMTALGTFYAQQKPKPLAAKDPALAKAGQTLYRAGNTTTALPACSSCHSPNGVGVPSNFPRVAGQQADYTYAQLKAFKAGERGNDKDGVDLNGKIMRTIATRMDDAQMKALADYTAGLR
ncbi:MAG: c-type cytochrome [Betaproteobacteria bacterium]